MNHPYLPLTDPNRSAMLQQIGVNSVESLLSDIPSQVRQALPLNLPKSQTEIELIEYFTKTAATNLQLQLSFLGAGAYQHYIPAVINH